MSSQGSGSTLLWYQSLNRESRFDPSNYRPVSLLHPIGKVFDAIQCNSLLSFLQENDIISKHQFGFLPERSTTMQLVSIVEQWLRGMETGHMTTAVFMDFRKAFDKVWHRGLLYKLTTAGVSLSSVSWLSEYLSSRTIAVRVGTNTISPRQPISAGVPQGSHLGPILSWSLSTIYLPLYLFQPSCMQMMLSFTSRHEKYSNRRAPYLTTPMTPSTDVPWNFKTPSLLLIYGRSPGMESLVLKKPRLFKLADCYTATPLSACRLEIKSSLMSQSTSISVFC